MNFSTAVRTCFRKYFDFTGRAQRSEFWFFVLFGWLAGLVLSFVDAVMFGTIVTAPGSFYAYTDRPVLSGLLGMILFFPGLAVAVRRLHDTDRSGWWLLIVMIPMIGAILLIVWFASRGTEGENRFGPDPLGGSGFGGGGEERYAASGIPRVPRD